MPKESVNGHIAHTLPHNLLVFVDNSTARRADPTVTQRTVHVPTESVDSPPQDPSLTKRNTTGRGALALLQEQANTSMRVVRSWTKPRCVAAGHRRNWYTTAT